MNTADTPEIPADTLEAFVRNYCTEDTPDSATAPIGRFELSKKALNRLNRSSSLAVTGTVSAGKTALFSRVAEKILADREAEAGAGRIISLQWRTEGEGKNPSGPEVEAFFAGLAERNGYLAGKKVVLTIIEVGALMKEHPDNGLTNLFGKEGIKVIGVSTIKSASLNSVAFTARFKPPHN